MPSFLTYPDEAKIIGSILAGYTDLEVGLLNCIQVVRSFEFDTVLKAMFRVRGETNRIKIADSLGRVPYRELDLEGSFIKVIGAMSFCMKVRNQYAHCVWWDDNTKKLAFANLEEVAKLDTFQSDLQHLTAYHADVPLLGAQEAYFAYTDDLTTWINYEGRFRAGKLRNQPGPEPQLIEQPPLRIP
jgi:hypothetical protein